MHTVETTNGKLDAVIADIRVLINWALADSEHAAENDAPETAKDDKRRARILSKAIVALQAARR